MDAWCGPLRIPASQVSLTLSQSLFLPAPRHRNKPPLSLSVSPPLLSQPASFPLTSRIPGERKKAIHREGESFCDGSIRVLENKSVVPRPDRERAIGIKSRTFATQSVMKITIWVLAVREYTSHTMTVTPVSPALPLPVPVSAMMQVFIVIPESRGTRIVKAADVHAR